MTRPEDNDATSDDPQSTLARVARQLEALTKWKSSSWIDLSDDDTRVSYNSVIDDYRRRYADRSLPELGALLVRVNDQIESIAFEFVSDRPDVEEYRRTHRYWLFQYSGERAAIRSLIDESRQSKKLVRRGPKVDQIKAAIHKLRGREFGTRGELLDAVDNERGLGKQATYRYLYRRFGTDMPTDVGEFVTWIESLSPADF